MNLETNRIVHEVVIDDRGAVRGAQGMESALDKAASATSRLDKAAGETSGALQAVGGAAAAAASGVGSAASATLDAAAGVAVFASEALSAERAWTALELSVATAKGGVGGLKREIAETVVETKLFREEASEAAKAWSTLKRAAAGIGIGLSLGGLISEAQEYTRAQNLIAQAVEGSSALVERSVYGIAQAAGASFTELAGLTKSLDELPGGSRKALDVVEGVALSMAQIPGNAQSSSAAITQFTQAMQSGVFRGDEFNSMMEQAPPLADALAKGLDVARDSMRGMAEAGELTVGRVSDALSSMLPELRRFNQETDRAFSQWVQIVDNAFGQFAANVDQRAGASDVLGESLGGVAERLESIQAQNAAVAVMEKLSTVAGIGADAIFLMADNLDLLIAGWVAWQGLKAFAGMGLFASSVRTATTALSTLEDVSGRSMPKVAKSLTSLGTAAAFSVSPLTILFTAVQAVGVGMLLYQSRVTDAQRASQLQAETMDMVADGMAKARRETNSTAEAMANLAKASAAEAMVRSQENLAAQTGLLRDRVDAVSHSLFVLTNNRVPELAGMRSGVQGIMAAFAAGQMDINGVGESLAGLVAENEKWRTKAGPAFDSITAWREQSEVVETAEAVIAVLTNTANDAQLALLGMSDSAGATTRQIEAVTTAADDLNARLETAEGRLEALRGGGLAGGAAFDREQEALRLASEAVSDYNKDNEELIASKKLSAATVEEYLPVTRRLVDLQEDAKQVTDSLTESERQRAQGLRENAEAIDTAFQEHGKLIDATGDLTASHQQQIADLKAQHAALKVSAREFQVVSLVQREYAKGTQLSAEELRLWAESAVDATENVSGLQEAQQGLSQLVTEFQTPLEDYRARMEEIENLEPFAKTPEQIVAIGRAMSAANDDLREAQVEADGFASALKGAAGQITNDFQGLFTDIFKDGLGSAGDFADAMINVFERLGAQLATTFALGDILGLTDSLGVFSGGFGSGLSSLISPTSVIGGLFGGGGAAGSGGGGLFVLPSFGGIGSLASDFALSSFGQSIGLSTMAPVAGGQLVTNGLGNAFVGGISAAPWGALGGIGASMLGLGSGNMLVDTGFGLAGSVGGGMAGSALGTALGFAGGGPVGAILGSFLSTALGGAIFGDDVDYPFAKGDVNLGGGGLSFTTDSLDDGDEGGAAQLTQAVVAGLEGFLASSGGSLTGDLSQIATIGYASGRSGALGSGFFAGGAGDFATGADFTNLEDSGLAVALSIRQGILKAIDEGTLEGVSQEFMGAVSTGIRNSATDDAEQLASDIDFSIFYGRLLDGFEDPLTAVEQKFQALAEQAEAASTQAERLGLALEPVVDHFAELTAEAVRAVENDLERQIRSLSGQGYLNALEDIVAAYDFNAKSAAAADIGTDKIDRLFSLQVSNALSGVDNVDHGLVAGVLAQAGVNLPAAALYEAQYRATLDQIEALEANTDATDDVARRFLSIADSRLTDERFSPLDPRARLEAAREELDSLFKFATDGTDDPETRDAIQRYDAADEAFLEASIAYYGKAGRYWDDFNYSQDALRQVANDNFSVADRQLSELQQANTHLEHLAAIIESLGGTVPGGGTAAAAGASGGGTTVSASAGGGSVSGNVVTLPNGITDTAANLTNRMQAYLDRYPDLQAAFGNGPTALSDAFGHYLKFGKDEGRTFHAGGYPFPGEMFRALPDEILVQAPTSGQMRVLDPKQSEDYRSKSEIVAELKNVRAVLDVVVSVLLEGNQRNAAGQRAIAVAVEKGSDAQEILAAHAERAVG